MFVIILFMSTILWAVFLYSDPLTRISDRFNGRNRNTPGSQFRF
jgi:hypothetical protein